MNQIQGFEFDERNERKVENLDEIAKKKRKGELKIEE